MPLFKVTIKKAMNTGGVAFKWSNSYYCEHTDQAAAAAWGVGIWTGVERGFHSSVAFAYEAYANQVGDAPYTPGTSVAVPAEDQRGTAPGGPLDIAVIMPAWNVVRVDLPMVASRPSRKFYRLPLFEFDLYAGQLETNVVARLNAGMAALFLVSRLRDESGHSASSNGIVRGVTSRRLGRDAYVSVPDGPPYG